MANTHTSDDEVQTNIHTFDVEPTPCYYGLCIVCGGEGSVPGERLGTSETCGGCGGDGKSVRADDEH